MARCIAVGGEEEDVCASALYKRRSFDDALVTRAGVVEKDGGSTGKSHTVCADGLQGERSWDERSDSVAASTTVSDRVSVDLVDDVSLSIVIEARSINRTTL